MITDLTVIYLTASLIPERFARYQRNVLHKAIGSTPLISVSRKPLEFGTNLLDEEERSLSNIYRQMLRAAKLVKTPFLAIAEDDALYPKRHFKKYRPAPDTFSYDMNRLLLFTWDETPMYSWKDRISNATLIAPRDLTIQALEERFEKYPNGTPEELTGELGRERIEMNLGLPRHKLVTYYSDVSTIVFNHDYASEPWQRKHVKRHGSLRSYDIPYWGKASEIMKHFNAS